MLHIVPLLFALAVFTQAQVTTTVCASYDSTITFTEYTTVYTIIDGAVDERTTSFSNVVTSSSSSSSTRNTQIEDGLGNSRTQTLTTTAQTPATEETTSIVETEESSSTTPAGTSTTLHPSETLSTVSSLTSSSTIS